METELFTYVVLLLLTITPPIMSHLIFKSEDKTTVNFMTTGFLIIPGYIHLTYIVIEALYLKYLKRDDG